jgi:hypothetical protein
MSPRRAGLWLLFAVAVIAAGAGCATHPLAPSVGVAASRPAPGSVLRSLPVDRALEARVLALDPGHVTEEDVRSTLANVPAPRIVLLHGGIYPANRLMPSFGKFLTGMGYPEGRIRHPGDGRWSHSPYEDSAQLAGLVAWYYEHDGTRPLLIGHSQGGIQAVKVLRELAGEYNVAIPVWNPLTDAAEERVTIVDPLTGAERPVVGVTVSYGTAVGAGGLALLMPNQWSMIGRLLTIPDTVDDFTGFLIAFDLVALDFPGTAQSLQYRSGGKANVRTVILPASYSHLTTPTTAPLAEPGPVRDWIVAYAPRDPAAAFPPDADGYAVLWAADVWYDVKKHWCLEAQRLIRARRAAVGEP